MKILNQKCPRTIESIKTDTNSAAKNRRTAYKMCTQCAPDRQVWNPQRTVAEKRVGKSAKSKRAVSCECGNMRRASHDIRRINFCPHAASEKTRTSQCSIIPAQCTRRSRNEPSFTFHWKTPLENKSASPRNWLETSHVHTRPGSVATRSHRGPPLGRVSTEAELRARAGPSLRVGKRTKRVRGAPGRGAPARGRGARRGARPARDWAPLRHRAPAPGAPPPAPRTPRAFLARPGWSFETEDEVA